MFMFGNTVKQDVLSNLRTPQGFIIGNDRAPAQVFLRERGYFIGPYVGKIFRLNERRYQTGIKLSIGGGLFQHKIRIQDDTRSVTQLTGEYEKGYDRLSNGPALYTFLGYQHIAIDNRLNFLVGVDYLFARTQNKRDWNFDEGRKETETRTDHLFGIRVGFILPLTSGIKASKTFY